MGESLFLCSDVHSGEDITRDEAVMKVSPKDLTVCIVAVKDIMETVDLDAEDIIQVPNLLAHLYSLSDLGSFINFGRSDVLKAKISVAFIEPLVTIIDQFCIKSEAVLDSDTKEEDLFFLAEDVAILRCVLRYLKS